VCVCSLAFIFRIRVNSCVFNIFLPFIAHSIFPQVFFVHNFCNLTDTVNLRRLESIIFILYPAMATSAMMRAMFERICFTPGAASSLEGNDHGINTLEEVVFLNDKYIDSLVKQLRRPGGMISGPATVGGSPQGNPGPLVANHGHSVSIRAGNNLKLVVFYLRHQARISRIVAPASVALNQGIQGKLQGHR
jgi:hypothetical protein